jgi:hypothetical protein
VGGGWPTDDGRLVEKLDLALGRVDVDVDIFGRDVHLQVHERVLAFGQVGRVHHVHGLPEVGVVHEPVVDEEDEDGLLDVEVDCATGGETKRHETQTYNTDGSYAGTIIMIRWLVGTPEPPQFDRHMQVATGGGGINKAASKRPVAEAAAAAAAAVKLSNGTRPP